jgi:hypothetical protein
MAQYKIKLYKYTKTCGFEEQKIVVPFNPSKVNGFGVVVNMCRKPVIKIVVDEGVKEDGVCQKTQN